MAEHLAMHVALLERMAERGQMYSAYLPEIREGRFTFQDRYGNATGLPLYITGEAGNWMLHSSTDVQFDRMEQHLAEKEIALEPKALLGVTVDGCQFDLTVEEEQENDFVFIPYSIPDHDRDITIGRSADSDIYYENGNVSRKHAVIRCRGGRLHLSDANSINGTYVNGIRMADTDLNLGDCVYIMGLYLIIGAGYIAINNANNRCLISPEAMRALNEDNGLHYQPLPSVLPSNALFNRQPRRKYELAPEPIEISAPPMGLRGNKIPLMLRMGSPALMGARAIATGNYMMAMSSMVLPFMTQGITEKDRNEYEERRKVKYLEYLQEKETELKNERDSEKQTLNHLYPSLEDVLCFAQDKKRLWEFRSVDPDFLQLRLGTGSLPLKADIQYPKETLDLEDDILKKSMLDLVGQDFSVPDAPILFSLREFFVTGVCGTVPHVQRLIANMIIQLAMTHSYDEVKIILLAEPEDTEYIREEMHLFRYLPHCWDNLKDIRFIADCKEDAIIIGEYLRKRVEDAALGDARLYQGPSYVVFAMNRQLLDCLEALKKFISAGEYGNVSIITGFEGPLKESRALLRMNKRTGVLMNLNESEKTDLPFLMERCDKDQLQKSLRQVIQTRLQIGGKTFTLPRTYTFLEMFGVGKVEYLNPLTRWKEKNPIKSLAAAIGIGTDGKVFYLDLHEKRQGPHGLIAGTTGSGKSEFIITYILSMAVNYSPEEVAFVLIDYKGGGLTTAFEDPGRGLHLPHVVGTITNLDGSTIQRSLTSITSELERRQRLFNEAATQNNEGKIEIYGYQRLYREGKVKEPLPHLFLIADEFAELKKQQPEFMASLISTARIGRSLGVHLILATQKPGGVVTDEIWTNTKFRVCLKVADRGDSMDMLKRPEAAELKETGRFYLQVGYNEYFGLGQSAWCGAEYMPQEEIVTNIDDSIDFLDTAGQVVLSCRPPKIKTGSGVSQLVAIVKLLSDLAKQHDLSARALWMPPLPEQLDLDKVYQEDLRSPSEGIFATIGLVDDPKHQCQLPLQLNMLSFHHMMIVGTAGSGKSTLLRTMLYTLCRDYGPESLQYYIIDLSGGALNVMKDMPHCGAYINETQEPEVDRLMTLLRDIVAERKILFREANVTNFNAYSHVEKLPLILFVLDGYSNITNFSLGYEFNNNLFQFLRDAAPYGVHFVSSINHLNEIHSKARMEIDYRIALQAKDKYDYSDILGARTTMTADNKPGRGLCVYGDTVLEYHVAMPDAMENDVDRIASLSKRMRNLADQYGWDCCAERLPLVNETQTYEEFCRTIDPGRIPLGYNRANAQPVSIPFRQLHKVAMFFGNPTGVKPVFANLMYAASREHMRITVIRSQSGSLFTTREAGDLLTSMETDPEFFESTAEGLEAFLEMFMAEVKARNQYRDEYCEAHGIPATDKGRVLKAADYIRQKTPPWMILFENFADLCQPGLNQDIVETFKAHFSRSKGYNAYFFGMFYPEDYSTLSNTTIVRAFTEEQFLLFFGGRYDKQCLASNLPTELRNRIKADPRYNRMSMKYRDGYYSLLMPCGNLLSDEQNPDEKSII